MLNFLFLSTLSLRRATLAQLARRVRAEISIHALLAESDGIGLVFMWWGVRFLSTLSLRRATGRHRGNDRSPIDFYPRSPCGERPRHGSGRPDRDKISIHALLAESDQSPKFLSTAQGNFYPRSPCGERRIKVTIREPAQQFLSTLSLRRATIRIDKFKRSKIFLSTLSLRRATLFCAMQIVIIVVFLSTLSLRRATATWNLSNHQTVISIHALLAESDGVICIT